MIYNYKSSKRYTNFETNRAGGCIGGNVLGQFCTDSLFSLHFDMISKICLFQTEEHRCPIKFAIYVFFFFSFLLPQVHMGKCASLL